MSKIIRKARSQLHSVKDEGIKRQFQAARNDLKHKRRTNTSRNASAGPGFKFSDIDSNDMDDFEWMESSDSTSGTTTNASPEGSGFHSEHSDRDSFHTSGYHSSHSADESTHSRDHSYDDEEIDITSSSDHGYDSHKVSHEADLNTSTRITETAKFRSSSLFDDGPDIDDDYFGGGGSRQDPLGASPSSETTKSLFDAHVIPEETLDDIFASSLKTKDSKSSTNDNLTKLVDSLFVDECIEETVEPSADKVLTDSEVEW